LQITLERFFEQPLKWRHNSQHNGIQHNGTQHNGLALQRGLYIIVLELTSFSIWISLLTELSKPCTLNLTNMQKKEITMKFLDG
jgi:hypothetical protein